MISISKYLKRRGGDANGAQRRALGLLLQLIEIHAVQADDVDYALFRAGIHEIAGHFSDDTPAEEILIIVGKVATALKEYSQRTTRYVKTQGAEYQRMVTMLTDTIAQTSHASERTVQRLLGIEKKLEKASIIEDVRVLRMQLNDCLESIRQEIKAQHSEAAASAREREDLMKDASSPESLPPQSQDTDAVTELPGRSAAESALADAVQQGQKPYYAVALVANRIASINSRFGHAVGDRVLRKLSQQLRGGFSAEDRLFRWTGTPGFMALLLRTVSESEVRKELARITGAPIEDVVEIGTRSVLLPISASWAVFALNSPARIIRDKIDQFIRLQASRY